MSGDESKSKRSLSPAAGSDGQEHHEQGGRQRARAACAPCRQRKRKCDGRLPCGTCQRYEYQCEYTSTKRASYVPVGDSVQEPAPGPNRAQSNAMRVHHRAQPLTAPGARFHHRGILDPTKTRYVRANSAIAFPRILAMDLESDNVPRLHSFAWNLGIRTEPLPQSTNITNLLTWSDMQGLAQTYFEIVRAEIGLLEESEFMEAAAARFANPQGEDDFDALILGVAALGSFFSANPYPTEDVWIATARKVLNERTLNRSPNTNIVCGWILRTLYLRLTVRPHAAWMASCITLHQVEATGLHKELQTIAVVYPAAPTGDHKLAKTRRRVFWIAKSLNVILSFEYGRSRVAFDITTTKKFAPDTTTHAHQFVELADILPVELVPSEQEADPPASLSTALTTIEEMQSKSSFINLLRADLAFGIFRRLWLMSLTDAKDRADSIVAIGKVALEASEKLLEARRPWWNVLGTTFQFLCVVLAIGSHKSLVMVSPIMAQLHRIAQTYDTHMVREAYNTALGLATAARDRKQTEMDALNSINGLVTFDDPPTEGSSREMSEIPTIDWANMELPFDWDIFLNPDLIISNQLGYSGTEDPFGTQYGFSAG